jgi:hypothetical protein
VRARLRGTGGGGGGDARIAPRRGAGGPRPASSSRADGPDRGGAHAPRGLELRAEGFAFHMQCCLTDGAKLRPGVLAEAGARPGRVVHASHYGRRWPRASEARRAVSFSAKLCGSWVGGSGKHPASVPPADRPALMVGCAVGRGRADGLRTTAGTGRGAPRRELVVLGNGGRSSVGRGTDGREGKCFPNTECWSYRAAAAVRRLRAV